jgi:hypothetical protein
MTKVQDILTALERSDFLSVLWLFPAAFALHEAEEWNIMRWYRCNYADLPPATDRSARTWIVFVSMVGFAWCAVAVLPGSPVVAAFVLLPAIAIALQNALQHVYWLFYFRQYAPGVVTSVALLIPIGAYIVVRAVQQGYAPIWYVAIWVALSLPGLVQTVRAENKMTPPMRAIHNLGIKLSERVFKSS